ncbi:MAG: TerB family tellurite resistance protein [Bdellovibrionales bacterium]|nr:TerB family tellurite resistance protein [Bdellovibrionales bacterium]
MIIFKLIFALGGLHFARFIGENPIGGLLVGVVIGHSLDLIASYKIAKLRAQRLYQRRAKAAFNEHFLSSLFHMLGSVCGCDGAVAKEEVAEVEAIIKETLKLSARDRRAAIQHFKSARTAKVTFQASAVKFFELYQHHPQVLEGTVQLLMRVAAADGRLNEEELRLVRAAATVFGLDERRFEQLKSTNLDVHGTVSELEKSYAVLGCEREATEAEIKKSYRKLVSTYHPDKIVSKELPEEFLQFATQKMKDIQAAYEVVKAERGFS